MIEFETSEAVMRALAFLEHDFDGRMLRFDVPDGMGFLDEDYVREKNSLVPIIEQATSIAKEGGLDWVLLYTDSVAPELPTWVFIRPDNRTMPDRLDLSADLLYWGVRQASGAKEIPMEERPRHLLEAVSMANRGVRYRSEL